MYKRQVKTTDPVALRFYVENPQAARAIATECKRRLIVSLILYNSIDALLWVYAIEPFSHRPTLGAHASTVVPALFWIAHVTSCFGVHMRGIKNQMSHEVSKVWTRKITMYFERIVAVLMDARREPDKISNDALMDKLALEQSEVEDFARGMNHLLSGLNGGMLVHHLIMVSVFLGGIGFVSANETQTVAV